MARRADQQKNIICLETHSWYKRKDRTTVQPVLELLRKLGYCDYLHRDVATPSEFEYFLDDYLGKVNKAYPILYLSFHGSYDPPGIYLGNDETIKLDRLAEIIDGRCSNRVVHFGSCSTMKMHGNERNAFVRRTQALAVCGYREEVSWLSSAAFDTLILGTLQEVSFTKQGMGKFNRLLKERAKHLYNTLGFQLQVKQVK